MIKYLEKTDFNISNLISDLKLTKNNGDRNREYIEELIVYIFIKLTGNWELFNESYNVFTEPKFYISSFDIFNDEILPFGIFGSLKYWLLSLS